MGRSTRAVPRSLPRRDLLDELDPTRCRSADVDRALRGVSDQGPADPTSLAALLLRTAGQRRLGLRHRCVLDALWRGAEGHGTSLEANERDRKSTRLNSSHMSIS